MALKKGNGKMPNSGRKAGTRNKTTKAVKDVIEATFSKLQQHPKANLFDWAVSNTTDFYKMAMKLIPLQIETSDQVNTFTVIVENEDDEHEPTTGSIIVLGGPRQKHIQPGETG